MFSDSEFVDHFAGEDPEELNAAAAAPAGLPIRVRWEHAINPDSRFPRTRETSNAGRPKGDDVMNRDQCLQQVEGKYRLMRDRLRSVYTGNSNGMYLFGPPGISKTHTVVNFLKDNSIAFEHVRGYVTGSRLFDLLESNPDGVLVLDDVSGIFKEPKAVQLLLAALGSPPDGSRVRRVIYGTAHGERVVEFTGGIIAISNLGLDEHRNDVIRALADRVHVQKFDPTPEQVEALIHKIGMEAPAGVAAEDAVMVAEFLAKECREQGIRLTIRLFIEKALPDFRMWKGVGTENHWEDLVRASVAGNLATQRHAVREISRQDQTDTNRRILLAICNEFATPQDRLRAWKERTAGSKTKFHSPPQETQRPGVGAVGAAGPVAGPCEG
jgi:hypothetical protein